MHIRRAEAGDEEALTEIRRRAILALAGQVLSKEQAEIWAARTATDRFTRAIRDHEVWIAVDNIPIGWVEVDRDYIAALYVSPSCSRRGIGSALLAHAETFMRSAGFATAWLKASPNALDFYLRRDYARCGPPDAEGAYPLRKELAAGSLAGREMETAL